MGALGAGAVLGVVLIPKVEDRLNDNLMLGIAAAVFGVAAFAAGFFPAFALAILLVFAGMSWIATFSILNSAIQLTLPEWVRARGLSVYLMVTTGAQALGALLWGSLATAFGYAPVLAAAGILLVAAGLSVSVLPLLPRTGRLDRSIAEADLGIETDQEPSPDAGPVTVLIAYELAPEKAADFVQIMHDVRLSRLRTGARNWELVHSVTDSSQFREIYDVATWREYLRQEQERTTGEDRRVIDKAAELAEEPPRVRWFLPASV